MIYCDLDGVLADFNLAFYSLSGKWPHEVEKSVLWQKINSTPDYWYQINKMSDADILLSFLQNYPYQILTGLPASGYAKAEKEKRAWVKDKINPNLNVICCLSKDKHIYCNHGDILIDDYPSNIKDWQQAGGIGILHTDAQSTIQQLKKTLALSL